MSEEEKKFWTFWIDQIIASGPRTAWDTNEKIAGQLCEDFSYLTPPQAEKIVHVFWENTNRTRC